MRKRMLLSMLLCLLLTTLVAGSGISPAHASIDGTPTWVGPKYDKDDFYGASFTANSIAFTTGTDATLRVTVKNTLSPAKPLNISAVKVLMDWGINYSSTEASQSSPHVIPKVSSGVTYYYTFTIVFTVPATTVASNLFRHYWWVFVEEVNATTGAQAVTLHGNYIGSQDFTVYSADQATAQNTRVEYDRWVTTFSPTSQEAIVLKKNAGVHRLMGDDSYKNGDFAGAKTQYQTALAMLNDAITAEETYQTTTQENAVKLTESTIKMNEAEAKLDEGQGSYWNKTGEAAVIEAEAAMIEANATMKMADAQWVSAQAASLQSTALNLFGFGFILFGVAAIIWAFKRPKPT